MRRSLVTPLLAAAALLDVASGVMVLRGISDLADFGNNILEAHTGNPEPPAEQPSKERPASGSPGADLLDKWTGGDNILKNLWGAAKVDELPAVPPPAAEEPAPKLPSDVPGADLIDKWSGPNFLDSLYGGTQQAQSHPMTAKSFEGASPPDNHMDEPKGQSYLDSEWNRAGATEQEPVPATPSPVAAAASPTFAPNAGLHHGPSALKSPASAYEAYRAYVTNQAAAPSVPTKKVVGASDYYGEPTGSDYLDNVGGASAAAAEQAGAFLDKWTDADVARSVWDAALSQAAPQTPQAPPAPKEEPQQKWPSDVPGTDLLDKWSGPDALNNLWGGSQQEPPSLPLTMKSFQGEYEATGANYEDSLWDMADVAKRAPVPATPGPSDTAAPPTSAPNAGLHHGPASLKSPANAYAVYQAYMADQAAAQSAAADASDDAEVPKSRSYLDRAWDASAAQSAPTKKAVDDPDHYDEPTGPSYGDGAWGAWGASGGATVQAAESAPPSPPPAAMAPPAVAPNAGMHHGPASLKSPADAYAAYQAYMADQAAKESR